MEVMEEKSPNLQVAEVLKPSTSENEEVVVAVAADLCQNSNGVDEIGKAGQAEVTDTGTGDNSSTEPKTELPQDSGDVSEATTDPIEENDHGASTTTDNSTHKNEVTTFEESIPESNVKDEDTSSVDVNVITEVIIEEEAIERTDYHDDGMIEIEIPNASLDNIPKFKTEVVIESNDCTSNDADEHDSSNNILSEFGESIELSEVLRSEATEVSENNNSAGRQEVFNKEELLDILEGNDVETPPSVVGTDPKQNVFISPSKDIESKLALQQLSRLQRERMYRGSIRISKGRKEKKYRSLSSFKKIECDSTIEKKKSNQNTSDENAETENANLETKGNLENKTSKDNTQTENIVDVLVMDWDDDDQEANESNQHKENVTEDPEKLVKETEVLKNNQETVEKDEKPAIRSTNDQTQIEKSGDENQPQRRLGRVIKKKVIFDPDNPDTFTKTKTKSRELGKDIASKDQSASKKVKQEQTPPRSKSKSPMSNLQWKKPSSKNIKQNRRLTEVDKLLMDEGAVNMIYQLTPEAPKGKKSRETKVEFIKKIQSSTPDSKEMKFRERKTLKYEEGEAKRILSGKHRVSLNSSIKSPSVSEDFETHSADDSIIYRRHSSSSYSSSCMSPRRLSDVDSNSTQTNTNSSQISDLPIQDRDNIGDTDQTDVFMSNSTENLTSDVINKDNYLSMKEKLNSKLSLALNKRKRESTKNEKPPKQKKVSRNEDKSESVSKSSLGELKHVNIKLDQRLAEISIDTTELTFNVEVLKEIEQALIFVNSIKETSVTLLTECCTLCSNINLNQLLEEDKAKRFNNALQVSETIRSLLITVEKHSKLLCLSVGAQCRGVGLALAALSDVVLASERASFALAAAGAPPLAPAAAALTATCRLPHSMVDDLILFGRELSASEALQSGLVSRILWPNRFTEQAYKIAKDIASEPASTVMLKKNLLNLKKMGENNQTFLSCLEAEGDIFVQHWTSEEGQELLRACST